MPVAAWRGSELPRSRPHADARRFIVLIWLVLAPIVTAAAAQTIAHPPAAPLMAGMTLAIAVAITFPVWSSWEHRRNSITAPEIFVGASLVLLPPSALVCAVALGVFAGLHVRQRLGPFAGLRKPGPWPQAFNLSAEVASAAIAVAFYATAGPYVPRPLDIILAVVAGSVYTHLASSVVRRLDAGLGRQAFRLGGSVTASAVVATAASAMVGSIAGELLEAHPDPWPWLVSLSGLVVAASFVGLRAARTQHRRQTALAAAEALAAATGTGEVDSVLPRLTRRVMFADRAEVVAGAAPPDWAALHEPLGPHGVLAVGHRDGPVAAPFDSMDRELLRALASVGRIALDNAALVQRLKETDQLRSMLLAAAAHDVRAPLSTTGTVLATLRHRAGDSLSAAGLSPLLDVADRANAKARRLVHDLIEVERQSILRAGRVHGCEDEPAPSSDVTAVVTGLVKDLAPGLRERFTLELAANLPAVRIDEVALDRALDNLLQNAVSHTPATSRIWVRAWMHDGGVRVVVEDAGPGVSADLRDQLFEPFLRGAEAKGFGLGLHVAAQFVRLAGGEIRVDDRDGGGASFQIWLPPAFSAGWTPASPESPRPELARPHVV